jgi:hypothetical protein
MSNVEDARSRLGAHRVSRIVSFAIFSFECARRYYNVSWSSDQKIAALRNCPGALPGIWSQRLLIPSEVAPQNEMMSPTVTE